MDENKVGTEELVVCRCMEVTEEEIRDAIRSGCDTVSAVKKMTKAGMGLCQGRTCEQIINRLIAEETKTNIGELPPRSIRPPVRPIKLKTIMEMEI